MIKYKTVKIEDKKLILKCELEKVEGYYADLTINYMRVDTPATYGTELPFLKIDTKPLTSHQEVDAEVLLTNNAWKDLLIITPIMNGLEALPGDTPCNLTIVNKYAIYDKEILKSKGLIYLKELGDNCKVSKGFIDFILRKYALDMAIDTCNYEDAIKYWKMFDNRIGTSLKSCSCNGG